MKLSIGQAWDEARRVLRVDGKAIFTIAFALVVLPSTIIETASPTTLRVGPTPWWISVFGLVTAMLGMVSQLAISRITLGPSTTVGAALGLAFRRLFSLFGALLLAVLPFVVLLSLVALSQGQNFDPRAMPPALALPLAAVMLIGVYVLIRLLFLTPLAVDSNLGPVALLRDAWRRSRGTMLKLFLLVLIVMLVALLLVVTLGGALSAVVILALGAIAPGNLSAVLVALIQQSLAAIVSVMLVVVVSRLYLQVTGGTATVSVPDAGHQ